MARMVIDMNETQLKTVAQLRAFLNGTPDVQFQSIGDDMKRYEFIAAVLKRLCYPRLGRADKAWCCAISNASPVTPASR
jgi:hypothetical protein